MHVGDVDGAALASFDDGSWQRVTLPLYSNLGTQGVYVYATDYDIPGRRATVHVES